ncbi:hypothetical protein FSP39_003114 [Pinctada imbricata]|uniref:Uncharacterized protein n=1 Tax=Pinctada imbricata TaxID=66713 RepID=A0AA88XWT9_PINIB|nr:hypothetical protein FSP39_003114 [Pinctada imbricata]
MSDCDLKTPSQPAAQLRNDTLVERNRDTDLRTAPFDSRFPTQNQMTWHLKPRDIFYKSCLQDSSAADICDRTYLPLTNDLQAQHSAFGEQRTACTCIYYIDNIKIRKAALNYQKITKTMPKM